MKDQAIIGGAKTEGRIGVLEQLGFRFGEKGTHTSRTIMLGELTALVQACPVTATRTEYAVAINEKNCLAKPTAATRQATNQRLGELYTLDPRIMLFRILRRFWDSGEAGRPLLALLLAMARDPLLRVTAPPIIALSPGQELGRQQLTDALRLNGGDRLNRGILDKVVRNAAASWTQSGHLSGRCRKTRRQVHPTPMVTCYALLLGHVLGARGAGTFDTVWARILDASVAELQSRALEAKRLGLMDVKQSGGIFAVGFDALMQPGERKLVYGAD